MERLRSVDWKWWVVGGSVLAILMIVLFLSTTGGSENTRPQSGKQGLQQPWKGTPVDVTIYLGSVERGRMFPIKCDETGVSGTKPLVKSADVRQACDLLIKNKSMLTSKDLTKKCPIPLTPITKHVKPPKGEDGVKIAIVKGTIGETDVNKTIRSGWCKDEIAEWNDLSFLWNFLFQPVVKLKVVTVYPNNPPPPPPPSNPSQAKKVKLEDTPAGREYIRNHGMCPKDGHAVPYICNKIVEVPTGN